MNDKEREPNTGEELEQEEEIHDENRREHDVMLQKEANQDVQTGTNDATHPGINWGPSYATRRGRKKSGERKSK